MFNVVKNPDFINQAFATVNGFCGRLIKSEDHPSFGKKHSEERRKKQSEYAKIAMQGKGNPNFGKKASNETRKKISLSKKQYYESDRCPPPTYNQEILDKIFLLRENKKGFKEIQEILLKDNVIISKSHLGNIHRKNKRMINGN
jgi:hypothetical protein